MAGVALVVLGRALDRVFEVGIEDKAVVVEPDILASDEEEWLVVAAVLAAVLVRLPSPRLRYQLGPSGVELGRWRKRVGALV